MNCLSRALVAVIAAVALGGCDAAVTTRIDVRSATTAALTAEVALRGEVADVVAADPELLGALRDVVADRTGVTPQVKQSAGELVMRAELDYTQLAGTSAVTGVAGVRFDPVDESSVAVTVDVVQPDDVVAALDTAAAGSVDGEHVAAAYLAGTSVVVDVGFPGLVLERVSHGNAGHWDDSDPTRARWSHPVEMPGGAQLVVVGSLAAHHDSSLWDRVASPWTIAFVVVAASLVFVVRGGRQQR